MSRHGNPAWMPPPGSLPWRGVSGQVVSWLGSAGAVLTGGGPGGGAG